VRPLPTVLFVGVVAAYLLWRIIPREISRRSTWDWLAFFTPLLAAGAVLLYVNRAQTGGALTTGYQTFHGVAAGGGGLLETMAVADLANASMSIVASLLRLNVWLLGWPFAAVLALFASRRPAAALLAACFGAELVYRILSPKAGVGGTGAVYFFEVVPALCLLVADGVARLTTWGRPAAMFTGPCALLLAGTLVSTSMFLPPRLADLSRMGIAQAVAPRLLRSRTSGPAIVFHEMVVPYWTRLSWAYFPPCNPPSLDSDVIYLRLQRARDLEDNLELWRRRFPERTAWYFHWPPEGGPELLPLEEYVRTQRQAPGNGP
jgi:hypothetical protein